MDFSEIHVKAICNCLIFITIFSLISIYLSSYIYISSNYIYLNTYECVYMLNIDIIKEKMSENSVLQIDVTIPC